MPRFALKTLLLFALILLCVLSFPQRAPRSQTPDSLWSEQVTGLEAQWQGLYEAYFGQVFPSQGLNGEEISRRLTELERTTGQRAAVIWLSPQPEELLTLMVLPGEAPLGLVNDGVGAEKLGSLTQAFLAEAAAPTTDRAYQTLGRELYDLLLAPLQPRLQQRRIQLLILCVGPGLRSLPFAALYDGRRYLVEDYALALIPGFNLAQIGPGDLQGARVLALGASEFLDLPPLPGVSLELAAIRQTPWPGATLENQAFTPAALRETRRQGRYEIVHLATHAR
ncbi:MAG: CHAT domain-containing protein, partial [Cyanobacteria bacterium RI_101]|nr:CHAT domain-containing protein [Cyanobacteria bacterium RI_101]